MQSCKVSRASDCNPYPVGIVEPNCKQTSKINARPWPKVDPNRQMHRDLAEPDKEMEERLRNAPKCLQKQMKRTPAQNHKNAPPRRTVCLWNPRRNLRISLRSACRSRSPTTLEHLTLQWLRGSTAPSVYRRQPLNGMEGCSAPSPPMTAHCSPCTGSNQPMERRNAQSSGRDLLAG